LITLASPGRSSKSSSSLYTFSSKPLRTFVSMSTDRPFISLEKKRYEQCLYDAYCRWYT